MDLAYICTLLMSAIDSKLTVSLHIISIHSYISKFAPAAGIVLLRLTITLPNYHPEMSFS